MEEQPCLEANRLIFLDEAGVDVGMSHNEGWAPVGETPVIERPLHGSRVNLLGAIHEEGPIAFKQVESSVTGEVFLEFLRTELCPKLEAGDVVVMDGPRIHRVKGVVEMIEKCGAKVMYLPAYSPELNPIEWAWSWVKRKLRGAPPRKVEPLIQEVQTLWGKITATLCQAWIQGCGYLLSTCVG